MESALLDAIGELCPRSMLVDDALTILATPPPLRPFVPAETVGVPFHDAVMHFPTGELLRAVRQVIDGGLPRASLMIQADDAERLLVEVVRLQSGAGDRVALLSFTDVSIVDAELQLRYSRQIIELKNRIRNMLGVVRSLVRRTILSSKSVEDIADRVEGRLNTLTRIQAVISIGADAGIDIEYLIADEFIANGFLEGTHFTVSGPKVRLRVKAAEALSLALHELLLNALEHGCFRADAGLVDVFWTLEDRTEGAFLVWSWRESGGPHADTARKAGLGREVLEDMLAFQWAASTTFTFDDPGLTCLIEVPIDRVAMGAEEQA